MRLAALAMAVIAKAMNTEQHIPLLINPSMIHPACGEGS